MKGITVYCGLATPREWVIKTTNGRNELLYVTCSCTVYPSGKKGTVLTDCRTVTEYTKET